MPYSVYAFHYYHRPCTNLYCTVLSAIICTIAGTAPVPDNPEGPGIGSMPLSISTASRSTSVAAAPTPLRFGPVFFNLRFSGG